MDLPLLEDMEPVELNGVPKPKKEGKVIILKGGRKVTVEDQMALKVKTISEIVATLIQAHNEGKNVNVTKLKSQLSSKNKLTESPKTVDIIAAIPDAYRKVLIPKLKTKPVRTASGIAVVAVMCKPHRCPHIAVTGNICVYCLAEDHQVLTDRGFMFLRDVEAAFRAQEELGLPPLQFASFDQASGHLLYEPASRLIVNPTAAQRMIEITYANEEHRWGPCNDKYSRSALKISASSATLVKASAARNAMQEFVEDEGSDVAMTQTQDERAVPSNGLSLLVTPEHDMFVKHGRSRTTITGKVKINWDRKKVPKPGEPGKKLWVENDYHKVPAGALLQCDNRDAIKMRASAPNGIVASAATAPHFVDALGLHTEERLRIFLEIYGFWLGDGSLQFKGAVASPCAAAGSGMDSVFFSPTKEANLAWLRQQLSIVGLQEGVDFKVSMEGYGDAKHYHVHIIHAAWLALFFTEYASKYQSSRGTKWASAGGVDLQREHGSAIVCTSAGTPTFRGKEAMLQLATAPGTGDIGTFDAKAREAEARLRAEAEEACKKLAAEEEQRRVKAQLAEQELQCCLKEKEPCWGLPADQGGVKSAKWMANWVWRLSAIQALAVLEGLRRADGEEAVGEPTIYTSSAAFRDEIVRLALHAGRASHFTAKYIAGEHRGISRWGKPIIANFTLWRVSYAASKQYTQPVLSQQRDVKEVEYTGRTWCVTVPHGLIVVRRAAIDPETATVIKASKPIIVGNCPGGPDSDFEYSTQSYTGYEPTSMRAIRARYNPYLQTRHRVDQLKRLGHSVDKVEFIIMGGTFMSLDSGYRDFFIRNLHDALSGHSSNNVVEAVRYSEQSNTKCIGITIETRPDHCRAEHLDDMLNYGCTRLEIGVQSIYEDVARDTNRGHSVKDVCNTFRLAKDAGYKVVAHMMPDLPNVGMERDYEGFREYFESPEFRTDGLKLYPTLVIRGTGLYELWRTGRYKNYHPSALIDLIARILALVPPWTRVYRIQRDIPMPLVTSGVEHGNLRELALARMAELGLKCRDVRTREVGIQDIHFKIQPDQVELVRRDYVANGGWETFLAYEDPKQDILIGLLRLRQCSAASFRPELQGRCSIVRELHVYGSVVPIHNRDPTKFQHQGYGTLLMEEAERIARDEHHSVKIAVISGVGTRHYYRKLGYELEGPYMAKHLVPKST